MSENWVSANARRACLNCGESGAALYVTPSGTNTRVCHRCVTMWTVRLTPREPLPCEQADPIYDLARRVQ